MNSDADQLLPTNLETDLDLTEESLSGLSLQDVEVITERLEGRKRQITARIQIPYPIEQVWQILTDYEHLADFIPNLATSQRLEHPQGGIRLEQVGSESFLKLKFCARVVLDMIETFPHQIKFQMVEGDFKEFFGNWLLQPQVLGMQSITNLSYTVQLLPPRAMPVGLIERRLSHNLAVNLTAIRQRAETLFGAT